MEIWLIIYYYLAFENEFGGHIRSRDLEVGQRSIISPANSSWVYSEQASQAQLFGDSSEPVNTSSSYIIGVLNII